VINLASAQKIFVGLKSEINFEVPNLKISLQKTREKEEEWKHSRCLDFSKSNV